MTEKTIAECPVHYWVTNNISESCIVFLHPAFANHHCFDLQVPYFAKTNKVITVDIIGHGKSTYVKGT
jgi:pimeloyl-ACP methyl ester carboxylesterase